MQDANEILKKVKNLEFKTKKIVDTLMQGEYHSIFKGRGIEFSDVREYVPGDDIRSIDWNITARMNHPYVKEFIEERNLIIYIVFDRTGSYNFGKEKEKKESAIEIAASIIFSAIRNNDKISLCIFTDKIEKFIAPKSGKKHAMLLLRELLFYEPKSKSTDLKTVLKKLGNIAKKRSIIFIISDFISNNQKNFPKNCLLHPEGWSLIGNFSFIGKFFGCSKIDNHSFSSIINYGVINFAHIQKELILLKQKHDVIAINLKDKVEINLPDIGYIELEDSETGEQILFNTSDIRFRKKFNELHNQGSKDLSNIFKKSKVDEISLYSDEDFHVPLKKFFKLRERRLKWH